jgi:hypothetical protein
MKQKILSSLLAGVFALAAASLSAAELASAKVFSSSGASILYFADGAEKPVERGDVLKQGDGLVVGPEGAVVLVFSNGSMLSLDPRASVTLAEMSQAPFSASAAYEQLSADPSVSTNLIELNYGRVSFDVKKLRQGSTFSIDTALGTAAVRGTKGDATFYPRTEGGRAIAKFSVSQGSIFVDTLLSQEVKFDADGSAEGNFDPSGEEESIEISEGRSLMIYGIPQRKRGFPKVITTPSGKTIVVSPELPEQAKVPNGPPPGQE